MNDPLQHTSVGVADRAPFLVLHHDLEFEPLGEHALVGQHLSLFVRTELDHLRLVRTGGIQVVHSEGTGVLGLGPVVDQGAVTVADGVHRSSAGDARDFSCGNHVRVVRNRLVATESPEEFLEDFDELLEHAQQAAEVDAPRAEQRAEVARRGRRIVGQFPDRILIDTRVVQERFDAGVADAASHDFIRPAAAGGIGLRLRRVRDARDHNGGGRHDGNRPLKRKTHDAVLSVEGAVYMQGCTNTKIIIA